MQKVGLLAGDGRLPTLLSEHVSFHHIVDLAHWPLPLGALDALVEALQGQGCDAVILAGGVDRGRFRALDAGGQWVAARAGADAGDGRLLDAFVAYFEFQGLAVVGATDLVPSLRTPVGLLTRGGRRWTRQRVWHARVRSDAKIWGKVWFNAASAFGWKKQRRGPTICCRAPATPGSARERCSKPQSHSRTCGSICPHGGWKQCFTRPKMTCRRWFLKRRKPSLSTSSRRSHRLRPLG